VFCGIVSRPGASTGSACVAIHAGAIPNVTPVISEIPNARNKTGMDGEGLIGTEVPVWNAKYRITLVPAKAMARPKAPPSKESTRLSVRACWTRRTGRAPKAMLSDICGRRSRPRTSIRFPTFAQTRRSSGSAASPRTAGACL
jgi:hypothetical protein